MGSDVVGDSKQSISPNLTQGLKTHGKAEVLRNSPVVAASLDFITVRVIY